MDIPEFYAGRCVFLTGATGFIGKVLLEKILRCCPDVDRVYVLIRSKKNESAAKRLETLLQTPLFARVLRSRPECGNCVLPVEGDTLLPDFGMKEKDIQDVTKSTSVVFHCAASVGFQDPLRQALEANVRSMSHMLAFLKKMSKLEAFIHLSTAYAYCYKKHIGEEIYPTTVSPEDLLNPPSWMTGEMFDKIATDLQGSHPNSYTYTKSLAENYLRDNAPTCKTAIVRPSIVTATWKEPMPGWCDSVNGPVGIVIAFGKGLLRTMLGNRNSVCNFVPVDIAVNLMLASAWSIATERFDDDIKVYNCTNCESNRFYWGEMSDCVTSSAKNLPLENPLRIPSYSTRISPFYLKHKMEWIVCHWIPAYIGDAALFILRKKPKFVRLYQKVQSLCDCLNFFTMGSWTWDNTNVRQLRDSMLEEDREVFYFDTSTIDWKEHMIDYHAGVKQYILKEKMEDVSKAKRAIQYRQYLSTAFTTLIVFVFCRRNWDNLSWILWKFARRLFKISHYLWMFLTSFD